MIYFPLIALQLFQNNIISSIRSRTIVVTSLLTIFLSIEVTLAGYQIKKTQAHYRWSHYNEWVTCINQKLGPAKTIWQAAYPDSLIDLSGKNRERTFYRTIDFKPADIETRKKEAVAKLDAIIHSVAIPIDSPLITRKYQGVPEKDDLYFVNEYPWMPDAQYSGPKLGKPWSAEICQTGPFWAMISTKNNSNRNQPDAVQ